MNPRNHSMNPKRIKPTNHAYPFPPVDFQAAVPAGWCVRCGGEIYRPKKEMCRRCMKFERRKQYDKREISQSLSELH